MANFAELNDQNVVIRCVVISNDDILDENGIEQEQLGIDLCNLHIGQGNWTQTSYNNNFRRAFAQQGFVYEPSADVFYNPVGPFPSWVLDENYNWQPPTPMPDDVEGSYWVWNEETLSWDSVAYPTPEEGE